MNTGFSNTQVLYNAVLNVFYCLSVCTQITPVAFVTLPYSCNCSIYWLQCGVHVYSDTAVFPVCPLLSQANLFPAALVYFGSDVKTGLFTATSIFVCLFYLLSKALTSN